MPAPAAGGAGHCVVSCVEAGYGRQCRQGEVSFGVAGHVAEWQGLAGKARSGEAGIGTLRQAWRVAARHGLVRIGMAGTVRCGEAW